MPANKRIAIASDHKGCELKTRVIGLLESLKHKITDCGTNSSDNPVDYPDYAKLVCEQILEKRVEYGILICSTGIGMAMCANRRFGIRAAMCHNEYMALKARAHNDANVLVLGANTKVTNSNEVEKIITTFLSTIFEGGRHDRRLRKIS